MSENVSCANCHKQHIYFRRNEPIDCKLENDLLESFKEIDTRISDGKIETLKLLKMMRMRYWKDKQMKGLIDDTAQNICSD